MWCSRPSAAVKLGEKASVCSLPNTHAAAGCEVWRYFLSVAFDRAKGNGRQATGLLQATALISLPRLLCLSPSYTHLSWFWSAPSQQLMSYQDPK